MKTRLLPILVSVLAVIATAWLLYNNITLNFAILSLFFLLGALALGYIYSKDKLDQKRFGILFIALATLGVCKTLSNYFYADNDVYSNSDHHAVKVEGVRIVTPKGFVLAGNSKNAFFDYENYHGTLTIKDYDEKSVTIKSEGFTQALYHDVYNDELELKSSVLLNEKSLIPLLCDDRLQLLGKKDTCELSWSYWDELPSWFKTAAKLLDPIGITLSPRLGRFFNNSAKKGCYVYSVNENPDTVSYVTVIKKGMDLNTIYGEVISETGFAGMNLLRKEYYSANKKGKHFVDKPFVLELNEKVFGRQDGWREIRVIHSNGQSDSYRVGKLGQKVKEITIPVGAAFSIGCVSEGKSQSVRFRVEEGQLFLDYVTPQYHSLASVNKQGSNNIYITTSLATIAQDQNPSQNIMFFNLFHNDNNQNHFKRPVFMSYISGPTTQNMSFLINRKSSLLPGEYIPGLLSKNGAVEWKMKVENFKDTVKHLDENSMLLFIMVLGVFMILCVSFGRPLGGRITCHTLIEELAYLSILLLLAFRLLLLWRAAMFPAVEQATIYELKHFFWNEEAIIMQFVGLNIFFAIVLCVKLNISCHTNGTERLYDLFRLYAPMSILMAAEIYLFKISTAASVTLLMLPLVAYLVVWGMFAFFSSKTYKVWLQQAWKKFRDESNWKYRCAIVLSYLIFVILLYFALKSLDKVILNILVPVSLYFLFEAIIWKCWPKFTDGIYVEKERLDCFTLKNLFSSGLGFSLLNGLVFAVMLAVLDGGYGIMFLSFFMLVTILKLYDFIRSFVAYSDADIKVKKHIWHILIVFALLFVCVVFFLSYKYILGWFATFPWILSIIAVFVVSGALVWLVPRYIFGMKHNVVWTLLLTLVFSIGVVCVVKEFVLVNHTEQRVYVHALSLEEGLKNTNTIEDERRFFEASINDYILNVYNEQANDVSAVGGGGTTYFKMQPHSKVGAMFGAQTSDILLSRFVIAEHGKLLPIVFIVLILLLLYWGLRVKTKYRASKMLLIQIPGLLFMHMLFVWLANTRLFIFLGQDFPLLSLHSKLAIMYFFVLLAVWVAVAAIEKINTLVWETECNGTIEDQPNYYQYAGRVFVGIIGIMMLLFWILYSPLLGTELRYKDGNYSLVNLLEETADKMKVVNELFAAFQKEESISVSNLSDVSGVVSAFNAKYDDKIQELLGGKDSFQYRMWEKFAVKGGAKNNSSASLVHVRRNNDILKIEIRKKYFNKNLPAVESKAWRGNVVAHKEANGNVRAVSENAMFRQYILPDSWVANSEEVVVLKKRAKSEAVINNDNELHSDFSLGSGYASACRRFVQDRLDSEGLENLASNTYFARNVVINGRRSFVYPMAEKFFWAYTFANEVAAQKRKNADKEKKGFHDDVAITIDKELSAEIYDVIKNSGIQKYMSVITADGDGQIRAMVDLKQNYILNPNNSKEMARIADDLYMDFKSDISDAYFGNLNLLKMKDGPGSSQKPIVWTAVASALDFNWKDLQIYNFTKGSPFSDGTYYHICKFNGETIYGGNPSDKRTNPKKVTFAALCSDENQGKGVGLSDFMHHSSNFYNALMLYIGSHPVGTDMSIASRNGNDESAMFVKLKTSDVYGSNGQAMRDKYDENFPILATGQNSNSALFKLNLKMSRNYENSVLFSRLKSMFDFNTGEDMNSLYNGLNLSTSLKGRNSGYAFGDVPVFQYPAAEIDSDRGFLRNAIHQAAVGGGATWQVAPWAMAQTFGRLTMLKKNYRLTLEPMKPEEKRFIPYSDEELSDGYMDARSEFISGMNKVFSPTGTIRSFLNGNAVVPCKKGDYFIYGKTGTANEGGTKHRGLHRLGIVITNKNIENLSPDELKDVKFYSVYFTSWAANGPCYSKVVDKIIESESFKKYMNGN